jgi:spherulation-specific family 4 protein
MTRSNGVASSVFISLIVGLGAILQSAAACRADSLGVIVPAYFYPGTGGPGGTGDGWAAMATAAAQIPITAVFNPDSGPSPGPPDANYVNAMTNLEGAGGKTVAYVFTDFGNEPLATVEAQLSTYISQYGSLIDGFFLDGMSLIPSTLTYYQTLDSYIKGLSSSYTVVGNPGDPFLNGLTPAQYLSAADILNIFEGPDTAPPGDPGFNNYPYGINWFKNFSSAQFSNIVYDAPTSAAMLADISKATGFNAGYVYVTDQTGGNPYAQLPSYWDQEVAAIASTSTPLPSPLASSLVLGGLIAAAAGWRGRLCLPAAKASSADGPPLKNEPVCEMPR